MALPQPNIAWPPQPWAKVFDAAAESHVWWEGDPRKLADFYGHDVQGTAQHRSLSQRSRRAWRAFWGQQEPTASQPKRLHVPVAADLGRIAASTLFSKPVAFVGDAGVQDRLDAILNTDVVAAQLPAAAESAAMLSGTFGRVVWDASIADHAFLSFIDADRAIPTFKWDRLVDCTFWDELPSGDDQIVLRWMQSYRPGAIDHALYQGTRTNLGRPIPLTEHPATAGLAASLIDGVTIPTGFDGIAAAYFPHHLPAPQWRHDPALAPIGRPDLTADVIDLLDAIDRCWSSWMNDLEIGRGRIIVSEQLLTTHGAGKGSGFDLDRSVYSPVGVLSDKGEMSSVLEATQFAIRVDEHAATFDSLLRRVISRVGYSPITFGLSDEVATTATEVNAKERDTNATRDARIRLWTPRLRALATALTAIDAAQFSQTQPTEPIDLQWPAAHQESPRALAETVNLLNQAQAVSRETKVAMIHPDWDERRRNAEVEAIARENDLLSAILPSESQPGDPAADGTASPTDPAV